MQVNQIWEYELGYWVLPFYWCKGFRFEMAHKSLEIAKSLGIESVVAFALTENVKSIGLMQKLGFQYETEITHADRPHVLYRKQVCLRVSLCLEVFREANFDIERTS